MYRITIRPTTFRIEPYQRKQNPFIDSKTQVSLSKFLKDHRLIERALPDVHSYTFDTDENLPDMVFAANAGLSLMNLPERVLILPTMKFHQRQRERPYIQAICDAEGIRTIPFPSSDVFEGQAEAKWFHGGALLLCTHTHRATRRTFTVLQQMLRKIYTSYNRPVPRVVAVPIESSKWYHTDLAMLEFDQTSCIVHGSAFSERSLERLREVLGPEHVHVIDDEDPFCLNAIVDSDRILTHRISATTRAALERITSRRVVSFDTSVAELSGGSLRCMVLDIHPARP